MSASPLRSCEATPPPGPLPEAERGSRSCLSPPLRFGEGAGGRGSGAKSFAARPLFLVESTASLQGPLQVAVKMHQRQAHVRGPLVAGHQVIPEQGQVDGTVVGRTVLFLFGMVA